MLYENLEKNLKHSAGLPKFMNKELQVLLAAMRAAGQSILDLQHAGFSVMQKANKDIVTQADLAANEILKNALLNAFPTDGWLSEETQDEPARLNANRVWIVDPIDGTKEFAQHIPEYAISVALVEKGEPILSAVLNPATAELFHAVKGQGAYLNEKPISCSNEMRVRPILLASRSEDLRGEWEVFKAEYEVRIVGSIAYKLALIAAGKADGTFSLGPKSEWDIAAGVLLVAEAKGQVSDQHQKKFIFNNKNVVVDGIIASTPRLYPNIINSIQHT